jgi:hypothetical protein
MFSVTVMFSRLSMIESFLPSGIPSYFPRMFEFANDRKKDIVDIAICENECLLSLRMCCIRMC